MKIKTNNRWRPFKYRYEVPEKVLRGQFDYQNADDAIDGFMHYRGRWYHVDEFMRAEGGPLAAWHGYASDSFFSGAVIRISEDGERYQIGTYYS